MMCDVILAAHGAGAESAANANVRALARRLQEVVVGTRVTAAFRQGEPTHRVALDHADRPTCVIVPLLTSDGYYARELRRDVERWSKATRPIVLPPIGVHPALPEALSRRVAAAARAVGGGPERTHVVVVGHGTARQSESRNATRSVAADIGARTCLTSHAAFLDDDPVVETVVARIPANAAIVVVPFLLGGGSHAETDTPSRVLTAAAAARLNRERIVVLGPLGELPELYEAIEQGVRNAMGQPSSLRVGARASELSRPQVDVARAELASIGVGVSVSLIETLGDGDVSKPISDFEVDDPFTRKINAALREGRIDIAVHSTS
jgi:sirohydrochlorin cobaltochelatase